MEIQDNRAIKESGLEKYTSKYQQEIAFLSINQMSDNKNKTLSVTSQCCEETVLQLNRTTR